MSFKVPNQFRIKYGSMGSADWIGNAGAFAICFAYFAKDQSYEISLNGDSTAFVIAADGEGTGWEHVSVHLNTPDGKRTPDWNLMCKIKSLFWDDEDCVIQFHPPKSQYVNRHPNVLHLWRKAGTNFETPPKELIG